MSQTGLSTQTVSLCALLATTRRHGVGDSQEDCDSAHRSAMNCVKAVRDYITKMITGALPVLLRTRARVCGVKQGTAICGV
jgi:hypothetical protein